MSKFFVSWNFSDVRSGHVIKFTSLSHASNIEWYDAALNLAIFEPFRSPSKTKLYLVEINYDSLFSYGIFQSHHLGVPDDLHFEIVENH